MLLFGPSCRLKQLPMDLTGCGINCGPYWGLLPSARARRSRPPERFSPDSSPRAQRHFGNPDPRAPPGPPAKRAAKNSGGGSGRNPQRGRGSAGSLSASPGAAAAPARRVESEVAGPAPRVVTRGSAPLRGRPRSTTARPDTSAAGGLSPDVAVAAVNCVVAVAGAGVPPPGPRKATAKTANGSGGRSDARPAAARDPSPGELSEVSDEPATLRSEGELSESDEEPAGGAAAV